jgi:hypothetical protein
MTLWIRIRNPDPDSESGSGSMGKKNEEKNALALTGTFLNIFIAKR